MALAVRLLLSANNKTIACPFQTALRHRLPESFFDEHSFSDAECLFIAPLFRVI
jgi:hypothetical protein